MRTWLVVALSNRLRKRCSPRVDTQRDYIRFVQSFAALLGQTLETATAEVIRCFHVYQAERGVQLLTINCAVSGQRFFFTVTLDRPDLSRRLVLVHYPNKKSRVTDPPPNSVVASYSDCFMYCIVHTGWRSEE